MYLDLNDAPAGAERTADICIIGAGAAGITAARRLLAAGHEVILLESGGLDHEAPVADLNAGESIGEPYYELDHARLRFFGGTTAIWGGRCAELDPIDFEKREWVPHSGWPIGWQDLAPYYAEARGLFGLPGDSLRLTDLQAAGIAFPRFDDSLLAPKLWMFDGRFNRFVFTSCEDLAGHPGCTVVTHATATSIKLSGSGSAVERVEAASLSGRRLVVRARAFLLAAGGIENARLLLASTVHAPAGLGNQHDQVGRYFMEHPHARGGRILCSRAWLLLNAFGRPHMIGGRKVAALITPSERFQAEARTLNTSLTIVGRQPEHAAQSFGMRAYGRVKHDMAPTKSGRALWMHAKRSIGWLQRKVDPLRPWLLHKAGQLDLALLVRAEQAPNPASRVTLSDARDALGVPRVRLDWRFTPQDKHSVEQLVWALGREFERLGIGHVEPAEWLYDDRQSWRTDPLVSAHPIGGYHHMGTTRMSSDPRRGVTDGAGRVHGVPNLYVAGSSLFPTSGWANPTLTIAALALRSADHMSRMLRPGPLDSRMATRAQAAPR